MLNSPLSIKEYNIFCAEMFYNSKPKFCLLYIYVYIYMDLRLQDFLLDLIIKLPAI